MNGAVHFWIIGLAEALVVCLALAVIFGVKWWQLRAEHRALQRTSRRVAGWLVEEVARLREGPCPWPELQELQIAVLTAWSLPFKTRRVVESKAWAQAMARVCEGFETLAHMRQDAGVAHASRAVLAQPSGQEAADHAATQASHEDLSSDIAELLTQCELHMPDRSAALALEDDLALRYSRAWDGNRGLQAKLEALGRDGAMLQLRDELEAVLRSNHEFMNSAAASRRNFKILVQQCDGMGMLVQKLQATIKRYRLSVSQLIVERDDLAEQLERLMERRHLTGQASSGITALRRSGVVMPDYNRQDPL